VLESEKPVLVAFGADWCGPWNRLRPALEAVAQEQKQVFSTLILDAEQHRGLAANYGVKSVPALLMFKGGKVVGDLLGAPLKKEALSAWAAEAAARPVGQGRIPAGERFAMADNERANLNAFAAPFARKCMQYVLIPLNVISAVVGLTWIMGAVSVLPAAAGLFTLLGCANSVRIAVRDLKRSRTERAIEKQAPEDPEQGRLGRIMSCVREVRAAGDLGIGLLAYSALSTAESCKSLAADFSRASRRLRKITETWTIALPLEPDFHAAAAKASPRHAPKRDLNLLRPH
jgi:thioredoxin 1